MDCAICMSQITQGYTSICGSQQHQICLSCYHKLLMEVFKTKDIISCPFCRQEVFNLRVPIIYRNKIINNTQLVSFKLNRDKFTIERYNEWIWQMQTTRIPIDFYFLKTLQYFPSPMVEQEPAVQYTLRQLKQREKLQKIYIVAMCNDEIVQFSWENKLFCANIFQSNQRLQIYIDSDSRCLYDFYDPSFDQFEYTLL